MKHIFLGGRGGREEKKYIFLKKVTIIKSY